MVMFLWVIGGILVGGLMLFMAYASIVGGLGVITDSRYERCPHCGHHGLVHEGRLHALDCPPSTATRVARLAHSGHGPRLGRY